MKCRKKSYHKGEHGREMCSRSKNKIASKQTNKQQRLQECNDVCDSAVFILWFKPVVGPGLWQQQENSWKQDSGGVTHTW